MGDEFDETDSIRASLNFLARLPDYQKDKPYGLTYNSVRIPRSNVTRESHEVSIIDLRGKESTLNFEVNGIAVLEAESQMLYDDFANRDKILQCYCREVAAILLDFMSADRVEVFDFNVRY